MYKIILDPKDWVRVSEWDLDELHCKYNPKESILIFENYNDLKLMESCLIMNHIQDFKTERDKNVV